MRNVSDAIDNALSTLGALAEVLQLEKQTMLVIRLSAITECAHGLISIMDKVLRYSLSPHIDVKKLRTTQESLLVSQR